MNWLIKINQVIEKCMPGVTPACLVLGVLFPQVTSHFLPYAAVLFGFMTFQGSLSSNFRQIAQVFRHPLPLLTILLMLHGWMPLLARLLGGALFGFDGNLVSGIVLEYVIPTGIVSFMWVSIYSGNAALTLSAILTDTVLAPALVPLSLKVFLGATVHINVLGMMRDMLFMIALPAVLGMIVNQLSHGRASETAKPALAPFAKLALMLVVSGNSSRVAPFVRHMTPILFGVAALILCLSASGLLWGLLAGKLLRQPRATSISMAYNSGLRNINAGAVLASAYFPPEVMFPVMISTLFQQILAAFFGVLTKKFMPEQLSTQAKAAR